MTVRRIHVKVGTHPTAFANLYGRHDKSLKVGSRVVFHNPEDNGRITTGRVTEIRDIMEDEPLYFVELM